MFQQRKPPRHARRRQRNGAGSGGEDPDSADDATKEKLAEVRQIQKEHWHRPRGVIPAPVTKSKDADDDEEEDDQWGLLDSSFKTTTGTKGPDPHLEAFLQERLFERKVQEEKKEKTREERLYEVPEKLQVPDNQEAAAEKMSWVAGLAEVALPLEYKLQNIEATETAKREFLLGGSNNEKGVVLEPDAVTKKAFGSRFLHFNDRSANSQNATDDAALERFRKRMRR